MGKQIEAVKPIETGIAPVSDASAENVGADASGAVVPQAPTDLVYPDGKPYVRPTEEEFRKSGYKQDYLDYFTRFEAELAEKMRAKAAKSEDAEASGETHAPTPAERQTYHVVGPGSVFIGGKTHGPRSPLQLTEDEAEDLGDAVKAGKAPPTKTQVSARKGGKYKVASHGNVCLNGKFHGPGTVIEVSQADAVSLGDALEDVK